MSLTPPQIVWAAHGSPAVDGCVEAAGRCYVCGGAIARGQLVKEWLSSSFTDQNRVRVPVATHVCEACVFVHSRTSPVLGRAAKEGKKFGGNFRNYSHCWDGDYLNASKGEKQLIREFLAREHTAPWFCAIADSGQKHVLSFTPLNGPGRSGQVRFEEANVFVPDDQSLVARMTELLTDGVTKDEVGSGNYYVRTMRDSRELAQAFELDHGASRGSNWFRLAIWLAQRDEEQHATRQAEKAARDAGRRDADRVSRSVSPRAKRAPANELLEPAARPRKSGSKADDHSERVGRPGATKAADTQPKQGLLPGFD